MFLRYRISNTTKAVWCLLEILLFYFIGCCPALWCQLVLVLPSTALLLSELRSPELLALAMISRWMCKQTDDVLIFPFSSCWELQVFFMMSRVSACPESEMVPGGEDCGLKGKSTSWYWACVLGSWKIWFFIQWGPVGNWVWKSNGSWCRRRKRFPTYIIVLQPTFVCSKK